MYTIKKTFKPGNPIIRENTLGNTAYIIESGNVEVSKNIGRQRIVLSRLGKGEIFGEMCLIDDSPRSATVTALEDTTVTVLSKNHFQQVLLENSELQKIFSIMAERLRKTDILVNPFKLTNFYYSLCSLIYYLAKAEGAQTGTEFYLMNYDNLVNECCTILALEKERVEKVLHRMIFTKLLTLEKRYLENEDRNLIIPDINHFREFVDFLRTQSASKELAQEISDTQLMPEDTYMLLKVLLEKVNECQPQDGKISISYERGLEIIKNLLDFSKEKTDKLFQQLINNGFFNLTVKPTSNTSELTCTKPERLKSELEKQESLRKFQKMVNLLKALATY
ncbi:MAG TPA: cyclic nucleotide-binding domain-containing protein [archaeon]|nr:cyclic nucleotide-binding domain-containing protein [archaeon]